MNEIIEQAIQVLKENIPVYTCWSCCSYNSSEGYCYKYKEYHNDRYLACDNIKLRPI